MEEKCDPQGLRGNHVLRLNIDKNPFNNWNIFEFSSMSQQLLLKAFPQWLCVFVTLIISS